jgi:transposase
MIPPWTPTLRMARFEEIYGDLKAGHLSCEDAAQILGCSARHFLRLRGRYKEGGLAALKDGRVGHVSRHRAADAELEELTRLYKEKYDGFNMRHFHEFAQRDHNLMRGYTWTRLRLLDAGLVEPSKRGGPHRLRRPRRPMRGMMIHQDASKHLWFGEDYCDLIGDDRHGSGQPVFAGCLFAAPQRAVYGQARDGGLGLHSGCRVRCRKCSVHPGRPGGWSR